MAHTPFLNRRNYDIILVDDDAGGETISNSLETAAEIKETAEEIAAPVIIQEDEWPRHCSIPSSAEKSTYRAQIHLGLVA